MELWLNIIIWIAYLISLYFSIFLILVYISYKDLFQAEKSETSISHEPFISIIIPAYNEEKNIQKTIDSALNIDYPRDKIEIIVVNHGSKDNTKKIVDSYGSKIIPLHITRTADDRKATAMNKALKIAKGEFFACLDADSFVHPLTLKKMLALYDKENDPELAIITPAMKVADPKNMLQKVQWLEYLVIILIARITSHMDSLYVAPGPFSLYRTSIIRKIGGFDEKNITEDQEIAYRIQLHQYKIKHCFDGYVYTNAPQEMKTFYRQRRRWYLGSISCLNQYKKLIANKKYGDFGMMQMTKSTLGFILSVVGILIIAYLFLLPFFTEVKNLVLIRFNIMPYITHYQFKITFLNFLQADFRKGFIILFLFTIGAYLFQQAHRNANEKMTRFGIIPLIPYFVYYYLIKSVILFLSMIEFARGKKVKW